MTDLKRWGVQWHREMGKSGKDWRVEEETADFLYGIVRSTKPLRVLEIGTFEATSAIAMGKALQKNGSGELWTIDIEDYGQAANVEAEGLKDTVHCILGPAQRALELKKDGLFDFIFIDDGHAFEDATRDLLISHSLLKQFGYIVGHDVLDVPAVHNALTMFLNDRPGQYEHMIVASYVGLFILKKL